MQYLLKMGERQEEATKQIHHLTTPPTAQLSWMLEWWRGEVRDKSGRRNSDVSSDLFC